MMGWVRSIIGWLARYIRARPIAVASNNVTRGLATIPSRESSISDVESVAIAIKAVNGRQNHVGLVHRDRSQNQIFLLDLAWHCNLRNRAATDEYLCLVPLGHPARLRQVAAICRQVWRANQGTLPYGFSAPNDCFDADTCDFLTGPTQHGLTCASFVLAVFHRAGLQLIRYETWPIGRPGDRQWQEEVVAQLRRGMPPAPFEHIQAVEREIGSVRFRPEEVAGAALSQPLPARFVDVIPAAAAVFDRIRNYRAD